MTIKNQPVEPFPPELTVHNLFEQQARKTPSRIAVEYRGETISYESLNNKAEELAAYCGCSYNALREEYAEDFSGFVELNRKLGNDPAAVPADVRDIYESCAATHLTP